jgi:hypothetical protein
VTLQVVINPSSDVVFSPAQSKSLLIDALGPYEKLVAQLHYVYPRPLTEQVVMLVVVVAVYPSSTTVTQVVTNPSDETVSTP